MPDDIGSKPQPMAAAPASSTTPAAANGARRKRLFLILGGVVVAAGLIWGLYWVLVGSRHVATDNAYVNADTAQVTALVAGPIVATPVGETAVV
ncbi:MAG: EmrA/EmrK family multidrug efflux transporter periplasmic adaptor subunit, partial [Brevundimonas sp.]